MGKESVHQEPVLAITRPEEGAGAAFAAMEGMLRRLGIAYVTDEVDMSLCRRVLNPRAVNEAVQYVKSNKASIYVKGPGITPKKNQVLDTVMTLEKVGRLAFTGAAESLNPKVEELRRRNKDIHTFAQAVYEIREPLKGLGSPNAGWRDALEVTLQRGAPAKLLENTEVRPPEFDESTPLALAALVPIEGRNRFTGKITGKKLTVSFTSEDGKEEVIGTEEVSEGTSVRISYFNRGEVLHWAREQIARVKDAAAIKIAHGTKQTVLKETDVRLIGWLDEALIEAHITSRIADYALARDKNGEPVFPPELGSLLVDDLFGKLSMRGVKEQTLILSPNHSYGPYVHDVWTGIKKAGGFRLGRNCEIIRASATRDHYKAIDYPAAGAGRLAVKNESGKTIIEKEMQAGDVAMATYFDRSRVQCLVNAVLRTATENNRNKVLFGFDTEDPYYRIAEEVLSATPGVTKAGERHYHYEQGQKKLDILVLGAAVATVEYLTGGVDNTTLVLNNIYGDFATDIEPYGKGTAYSIGVTSDGRAVVELGAGGTAPDLLTLWKETGTLRYNPMCFIDAISRAERARAMLWPNPEGRERALARADAMEDAMYITVGKGIILPVVEKHFRLEAGYVRRQVSTATFLQSVELEAIRLLQRTQSSGGKRLFPYADEAISKAESALNRSIAIDQAFYKAEERYGNKWKRTNLDYHNSGKTDSFDPDYTIPVPEAALVEKINADTLMALQSARVELAKAPLPAQAEALAKSFEALGISAQAAKTLVQEELESYT